MENGPFVDELPTKLRFSFRLCSIDYPEATWIVAIHQPTFLAVWGLD